MKTESPLKHLIFDCDGVLIDSEFLAVQAAVETFSDYGLALSPESYTQRYAGLREKEILQKVEQDYQRSFPEDFLKIMQTRIGNKIREELEVVSGMKELVSSVDIPKSVVSNGSLNHLEFSLNKTGLEAYFQKSYFTYEMVPCPKPAPDVYLHALDSLNLKAEETIVVEDSPTGVEAAHSAGLRVIGFLGARHIENKEKHAQLLEAKGAYQSVLDAQSLKQVFLNLGLNVLS